MKKILFAASMLVAMVVIFGLPSLVVANHLSAPTGLACPLADTDADTVNDTIAADWDDLAGATKYSVNVIAGYDTDGDTVVDITDDFDFGTSDRTDGGDIGDSDLPIPLAALNQDVDADTDVDIPIDVDIRVKGLHSGQNQGRQNNPFSGLCDAV